MFLLELSVDARWRLIACRVWLRAPVPVSQTQNDTDTSKTWYMTSGRVHLASRRPTPKNHKAGNSEHHDLHRTLYRVRASGRRSSRQKVAVRGGRHNCFVTWGSSWWSLVTIAYRTACVCKKQREVPAHQVSPARGRAFGCVFVRIIQSLSETRRIGPKGPDTSNPKRPDPVVSQSGLTLGSIQASTRRITDTLGLRPTSTEYEYEYFVPLAANPSTPLQRRCM